MHKQAKLDNIFPFFQKNNLKFWVDLPTPDEDMTSGISDPCYRICNVETDGSFSDIEIYVDGNTNIVGEIIICDKDQSPKVDEKLLDTLAGKEAGTQEFFGTCFALINKLLS